MTDDAPMEWSPDLAYAVGLLATDGCLASDRNQVFFTSKDLDLIKTFLGCIERPARLYAKRGQTGSLAFQVNVYGRPFYAWLRSIGLHPRKSMTMGAVAVPERLFIHFARGLL